MTDNSNGNKKHKILLATGGSGGHVFPAEALVSTLDESKYEFALITDKRGNNFKGELANIPIFNVSAGAVTGKGLIAKIKSTAALIAGVLQAAGYIRRFKPDLVVGFGGYASVPGTVAAVLAGIPLCLHEQNAVLGRANRLMAKHAKLIATSFSNVKFLPESVPVVQTGMPVRTAIAQIAQANSYNIPKDEASPLRLFVMGGSQGARAFSDIIPQAIITLPENIKSRLQLTQQCRPEDLPRVKELYEKHKINARLESFFTDVPAIFAASHLVISRSGSSSVAELIASGRPSILVPLPTSADDHQTYNARELSEKGGAWLMPQNDLTPKRLSQRLADLFSNFDLLTTAAQCATKASTGDAAQKFATEIDRLSATHKTSKMKSNNTEETP